MKQNYNNESLARLGHGKWKSALGHTLLIIGMVLMSLGVYAQSGGISSEIPAGLKMSKQWIPNPNDPTGSTGKVVLETYVTGSTISATAAVPNDIVLVLDQSGSMDENYSGTTKKVDALKSAVETFCKSVKDDAIANGVDHKIAIVGFATGRRVRYYGQYYWDWTNTELLSTQNEVAYGTYSSGECTISDQNFRNALVVANNNGNLNSRLTTAIDRIDADGGTCMQYGLDMAYGVLSKRTVTTFTAPDGTTKPRGQIVIFFTDGYPGLQFPTVNNQDRFAENEDGDNTNYVAQSTADATVEKANILKQNGATIFSLGIFEGADPEKAYTTIRKEQTSGSGYYQQIDYYYWEPQTLPSDESSGDAAANGLLHMISSNYDGENVALPASWLDETTNTANVANRFWHQKIDPETGQPMYDPETGDPIMEKGYYFGAGTPEELNAVFSSIANQSGAEPIEMSAETMVQDEVSSYFTLPENASINDIEIYAVKCTGGTLGDNNTVVSCKFETPGQDNLGTNANPIYYGTKTTYDSNGTILYLTLDEEGVVEEGNNLPENRLNPNGIITFKDENGDPLPEGETSGTISLTGFNFMNMFCGPIIHNNQVTGWQGRKLVIMIPLQAAEGVWGDGVVTNGPMSFVLPDGSQVAYAFEVPVTNVMGSVWTEVVYEKPGDPEEAFDPMNIDSPEKLAWFISMVNGRVGYEKNNKVASNTTLNGRLTADIDMSAHNWVPIGCGYKCNNNGQWLDANGNVTTDPTKRVKLSYEGTFDGNGHVITGLKNNATKFYKQIHDDVDGVVVFPGMFSNIDGGTVHDVFILDSDFRGKYHDASFIYHGILADTLTGGTIYNCEAAGRMTCNNDEPNKDKNLVYGGLVGLNNGGTIYNSMAMAQLTGYAMGGAVGENRSGSFTNSFTNGQYSYIGENGTNAKPVGGIAATNGGTISNCYVRFVRDNENLDKATFGMLTGTGTSATDCYTPELVTYTRPSAYSINATNNSPTNINETVPNVGGMNPYTLTVTPTFYNMFINDNMSGGTWSRYANNIWIYNNGTPLLTSLNNNKGTNGAKWKRTTAGNYDEVHGSGNINEDYPVLQLPGYTCLASTDGITIDYAKNLSDMLHRHNSGALNENTNLDSHPADENKNFYKPTDHPAINGGTINLFANEDNRSTAKAQKEQNTDDNVVVYIDEDVSLLQDNNSSIEAYTSQTVKSFVPNGKERWHYVSSSLQNSDFGWTYGQDAEHTWDENPCLFTLAESDEDHALFPIDLRTYDHVDFYCFYEPQYHWINFKRNSNSHFHMDNWDANTPIAYTNETAFKPGKGYLMSLDMSTWASYNRNAQFLQNRGTLNNGTFTLTEPVSYTSGNEWTGLAGYNLLGNPYQSYLDFTTFAWENSSLWNDASEMTFAIYDPSTDSYIQGMAGAQPSQGALASTGDINMHQGFLIRVSNSGNATFNNNMRSNTPADGTHFRGERPAYPLINFILNDSKDNTDIAVLELNRPENSGALKLRAGNPNGRIYFRHDNTNMAIFFRDNAEGHQSLNFAAEEDGNFTLSWNTANADFRTLTLVDNITGIKTDMLTHDHYTFEGRVDDYNTRFKIVFGEMNNNEEEPVLEHFAFFDHGNLIVNGTGHFEVVDVLGRVVYATELTDTQNTVSLPSNVRGVCMLCFTRNNETKVQKMVIQ